MTNSKHPSLRTGAAVLLIVSCLLCCAGRAAAQTSQGGLWAWMSGERYAQMWCERGTKGVAAPGNWPGQRTGAATWVDRTGNLWLFSGITDAEGSRNDLWMYAPSSGLWTWVEGDLTDGRGRTSGKYVFAATNTPGRRHGAATWVDAAGNFWLYGGEGLDIAGLTVELADLWKFDPQLRQWAFMGGEAKGRHQPVFATRGQLSVTAMPGGREYPAFGKLPDGRFWLYGGVRVGGNTENRNNCGNDLWVLDPALGFWTWVAGDELVNAAGRYEGTETVPGARSGAQGWCDAAGRLWIFGGHGVGVGGVRGALNDLWRYDFSTAQWTFVGGASTPYAPGVFGVKGVPESSNQPGARHHGVLWGTPDGSLWLFGGGCHREPADIDFPRADTAYNDLWRYTPSEGRWTWMRGDSTPMAPGRYSRRGLTLPANESGSRMQATVWIGAGGVVHMFGGSGCNTAFNGFLESTPLYDHCRYDPAADRWTWLHGYREPEGYAAPEPNSAASFPAQSLDAINWMDAEGRFHLYNAATRQFWMYTPGTGIWTPLDIDTTMRMTAAYATNTSIEWEGASHFGKRGVADAANVPGVRNGPIWWTDAAGRFWMLGGWGHASPSIVDGKPRRGGLSDIWRYDPATKLWAWMGGDTLPNNPGNVTSIDTNFTPGQRYDAAFWTDVEGDLWMFGGNGNQKTPYFRMHSDLWKLDPETAEWTLIERESMAGSHQPGRPGDRAYPAFCKDSAGNFLLFGGLGVSVSDQEIMRNDLWSYNPVTEAWTWIYGDTLVGDKPPVYGTRLQPSKDATPGSRMGAVMWCGRDGLLYLFGGRDDALYYNDIWSFNLATREWAWLAGDSVPNGGSRIVTERTPDPGNMPPGMEARPHWVAQDGAFWVFADSALWKYSPGVASGTPSAHKNVEGTLTARFLLAQGVLEVEYDLPRSGYTTIDLFTIDGRKAATLYSAGNHEGRHRVSIPLDASAVRSGTYLLCLESGGRRLTQPLHVVR